MKADEENIILPESAEAAHFATVQGWVSRTGHFFGDGPAAEYRSPRQGAQRRGRHDDMARMIFGVTPPSPPMIAIPDRLGLDRDVATMSTAALETYIDGLEDLAEVALDAGAFDQIDALCLAAGRAKYELHQRLRAGRVRCESCQAFLPSTPDEQCFSADGDNLDIWHCTHCGGEHRECY